VSKRQEAIKALRDMTDDELQTHVQEQRRRLFELRFQMATGQVANHRQVRDVRREIARTLATQTELARHVAAVEQEDG
jgi:large subunit ribosomal protein L29